MYFLSTPVLIKHGATPKCHAFDESHEMALISRAKCPQNYLSPKTRLKFAISGLYHLRGPPSASKIAADRPGTPHIALQGLKRLYLLAFGSWEASICLRPRYRTHQVHPSSWAITWMWSGSNGRPGIQKGPKLLRLSPWRTELGLKLHSAN